MQNVMWIVKAIIASYHRSINNNISILSNYIRNSYDNYIRNMRNKVKTYKKYLHAALTQFWLEIIRRLVKRFVNYVNE